MTTPLAVLGVCYIVSVSGAALWIVAALIAAIETFFVSH
jgi:hypothetical protein